MAEEHGFHAPEGHILCANNCGFLGSPATMNMCSKCYHDLQLKQEHDALAKAAFDHAPNVSGMSAAPELKVGGPTEMAKTVVTKHVLAQPEQPGPAQQPNRCTRCRKRVGLTGFKCRCGSMFCGSHRYPELHECTFDYKKVGKEAIAKANPVVKAQKLNKI